MTKFELLEDSIVIHHDGHCIPVDDIKEAMRFGLSLEAAVSLIIFNKYLRRIPHSLLVQTFMRKLQDGMDRRRP